MTRERADGEVLDMVEGGAMREDKRGVPGTAGHHRLLSQTCPWHTRQVGRPCHSRLNTGAKHTGALVVHEALPY